MKPLKAIIPEMTMFPATTAIPIPCHLWMPPLALVHPNSLESLKLEQQKRGPYAGAVGYFSFSGNIDTCITLRTSVIKNGTAYIQAGGGIVADSTDEDEYLETYYKSGALLKAIENAESQFNS